MKILEQRVLQAAEYADRLRERGDAQAQSAPRLSVRFGVFDRGAFWLALAVQDGASTGGAHALLRLDPGQPPVEMPRPDVTHILENAGRIVEQAWAWALARWASRVVVTPMETGWLLVADYAGPGKPVAALFWPFEDDGFGAAQPLEIATDLPVHANRETFHGTTHFQRRLSQEEGRVSFGWNMAAVRRFSTAAHVERLGFLSVDAKGRRATWQAWPQAPEPSQRGVLARLLGRGAGPERTPDAFVDFPQLHGRDYPNERWALGRPCVPLEVSIENGRVLAFTRGNTRSTKYGTFGASVVEIGVDGSKEREIWSEDFLDDRGYHGRYGRFVDAGRHFVLRSQYKSTDPWNGAECLIDTRSGQARVLSPPRGCKGMRLVDLEDGVGWFARPEKNGDLKLWRIALGEPLYVAHNAVAGAVILSGRLRFSENAFQTIS